MHAGDPFDFRMRKPVHNPGQFDVVKPNAVPSETPHYSMGVVGGSAAVRGEARWPTEGTWGWDYDGALISKRIWLGWLHDRQPRGGTRGYKTDGPKLLGH